MSNDEQTLYVSLWGSDEVVAFNTASQTITTTIKTGSHPNELLLNKNTANNRLQYIAGLFKGSLSMIVVPNADRLKTYTKQVYANTPFTNKEMVMAEGESGNPIPRK